MACHEALEGKEAGRVHPVSARARRIRCVACSRDTVTGRSETQAKAEAESFPNFVMASKVHQLAEFMPLLDRLEGSGVEYVLIGGLAVAHFGEFYLSAEQKAFHRFPIYSKDIDFCGGRPLYECIQREAAAAGLQASVGMGVIKPKAGTHRVPGYFIGVRMETGENAGIEILETLPLHNLNLTELRVKGSALHLKGVTVLDPFTLLLAKLAAYHERPQAEANHDAAHIDILMDVISVFLPEAIERCRAGTSEYDPAEDAWRLLKVLELGKHPLPSSSVRSTVFLAGLKKSLLEWLDDH